MSTDLLTTRQADVLRWITKFINKHGYPPTYREIGDGCAMKSSNGVTEVILALERKGYISRKAGQPRTLKVLGVSR